MERNAKLASAVALFVVVASALVVIPSLDGAYAETTVPAETGGDALLGQAVDGTIVLQNDVVLTSALIVTGELTIDLNGHGIVNSDANANHTIEVSETGDLTIEDSVGTGTIDNVTHAKAAILNNGAVDITGGKITRSLESADNTYYVIDNHGEMTVSGTAVVSKESEEQHSSMIRNADGATLTIQGGTFESGKDIAVKNDTGGVLRIYDGTFTPAKLAYDYAVQNWGTATIMGGTFNGIVASMSDDDSASTMTVENGTFGGKVVAWNFVDKYVSGMDPAAKAASVTINGGNFSTTITANCAAMIGDTKFNTTVTDPSVASYVVNGGTFGCNVSDYLADDVVLVNRDGKYVVTQDTAGAVAMIGQTYFTDLETPFKMCENSTVVIIDDVTLDASVTIKKNNAVVDLNGHIISGELEGRFVYTHDKVVTFKDSVGGGAIMNLAGNAVSGEADNTHITIESGIYTGDVSAYVPEGKVAYDFQGVSIVSEVVSDPMIIIDDVPFASMDDVADLINAAGVNVEGADDTLTLLGDFQVGGAKVTIPSGSDVTIDLNGNDMVFAAVDVAGTLTLTDDSQNKGSVTCTNFNVNGGTLTGDVLVGSTSGDALVYINGSGTVSGLGFDISDMTGGAVTISSGATGAVTISDVIVIVDGPESVVDRGIYVNQTAEGGSVTIADVVFNFNDNDACPVNIDIDSSSVVKVSDLTYNDCARPNKFLVNATSDVTVGSEGNLDFDHAGDAVFWDAADEGNTFTVAGELIVDGLLTVTSGGQLVVPADADMIVNGSIVVTSDASVTGELVFGSDRANSIDLSDVVAGDSSLKLSLGSVVISGSVVSGRMVLNGNGMIEGDVDMGAATLEVPKDSSLVVPADASVSGTAAMKVAGVVSVFGSVATPLQNSGTVSVYEGGEITGKVSGTDVIDMDEVVVAIGSIKDVSIGLGQELRVAVAVIPVDARITASVGETPLDVNGRIISWTPDEAGTYTVSVTAEYDGQVDTETFKVIVSDPSAEDDDPIDWRLVVIGVILVVMVIALIARFV